MVVVPLSSSGAAPSSASFAHEKNYSMYEMDSQGLAFGKKNVVDMLSSDDDEIVHQKQKNYESDDNQSDLTHNA